MDVSPHADWIDLTPRRPAPLEAVVLVAVTAAFGLIAGLPGLVVGVIVAAGAVLAGPLVAFGLAQAGLLAVTTAPTLGQVALVQAAAFGLLLVGGPTSPQTDRTVAMGGAVLFASGGLLLWTAIQTVGRQPAAIGLVVVVGFASYLCHRYERVVVGLAGGEPS